MEEKDERKIFSAAGGKAAKDQEESVRSAVQESYDRCWEMISKGDVDVEQMEKDFIELLDFWKQIYLCTLGISLAPAFAADFPPVVHKFNQRTHRVRLINFCITAKKSSRKFGHKEIPRVHI